MKITYYNVYVEMDGERHLADVEEYEISDGHKHNTIGYVCKVCFKKPIQTFPDYKQATILGLTTKFYCVDCKTIIEASEHKIPLQEPNT